MSSSVAIVTLGCKTNQFESAAMSEQLQQAGYQQVAFDAGADLVIVNTCTVTAATDAQSRKLIRRARRLNSKARIVVTGCCAQIDPQSLNQLAGVSLVIGNNEKGQLLKYLDENKNYEISSGSSHVVVSELLPWIAQELKKPELITYYGENQNILYLSQVTMGGPLEDFRKWHFNISGRTNTGKLLERN